MSNSIPSKLTSSDRASTCAGNSSRLTPLVKTADWPPVMAPIGGSILGTVGGPLRTSPARIETRSNRPPAGQPSPLRSSQRLVGPTQGTGRHRIAQPALTLGFCLHHSGHLGRNRSRRPAARLYRASHHHAPGAHHRGESTADVPSGWKAAVAPHGPPPVFKEWQRAGQFRPRGI